MSDAHSQIVAALLAAENKLPEEADYALIGRIALNAASLEYQIENLIWYYMGSVDLGHVATTPLGSQQKTDMLASLVEWTEPDDGVADAITYIIEAFHILRISRNTIAHGYNFQADKTSSKLTIERRTKSLIFDSFEVYDLSRGALHAVSQAQSALALFVWKISSRIQDRPVGTVSNSAPLPAEPLQLPAKPPLPGKLTPLPLAAAKSRRRLRQEHLVKEAKESLRGRRGKKPSQQ